MSNQDEYEYSRIADLIAKQIKGEISAEETAELHRWLKDSPNRQVIYDRLTDEATRHEALRGIGRFDEDAAWTRFEEKSGAETNIIPLRRRAFRYTAAAAVVAGLTIGGYFLLHKTAKPVTVAARQMPDLKPGSNGAILTLANGQKIVLGQAKTGIIAKQGNTSLNKAGDSLLVYQANGNNNQVEYNTIETPKGKQYALVLPDGTKAWLNAGSTLRYPVAFNGSERRVELTGEAYFEVVHNAKQPFRVQTPKETIEDIGTAFNVNAYNDEPATKTTLLQGAVQIRYGGETLLLQPGQEAANLKVSNVVAEDAIDWHEGYFRFNHEPLTSVMQKISRWYDVDVVFADESAKNVKIYGSLSRFSNVSKVLELLELTGSVKCRLDGHTITVNQNPK